MLRPRIIPALLIEQDYLVKTVRFKYDKYIGDPINTLRLFNEKEVDEIVFLDISASKRKVEPNYNLIKDLASECFMPMSYGGGITNLKQIEKILNIGIEKIVVNTQAIQNKVFLKEAVENFGSTTIIGAIDVKRNFFNKLEVFSHAVNKSTGIKVSEYLERILGDGVGEIFINDVDRDGTYTGYDLNLIKKLSDSMEVPMIICGGASGYHDLTKALAAGASAVAAGSIFIFNGPHRAVLITYPGEEDFKMFAKKAE
jgi:cyclase